jgi:hypothetical protein
VNGNEFQHLRGPNNAALAKTTHYTFAIRSRQGRNRAVPICTIRCRLARPPTPRVVVGHLSAADLRAIAQWVALNAQAILDHWNGLTDGVQLGQQLRRLP